MHSNKIHKNRYFQHTLELEDKQWTISYWENLVFFDKLPSNWITLYPMILSQAIMLSKRKQLHILFYLFFLDCISLLWWVIDLGWSSYKALAVDNNHQPDYKTSVAFAGQFLQAVNWTGLRVEKLGGSRQKIWLKYVNSQILAELLNVLINW